MKDEIKKFYSELQFPGKYSIDDLEFYDKEGIHNIYLKEIESIMLNDIDVLDIGCGTGLVSNLFAKKYPTSRFTSIDFSDSINYGRDFSIKNKINNIRWIKKDFLEYKSDKEFDLIICCGVLHHIPEYQVALEKIKFLLKPKGMLLLAVYNPYGKILKRMCKIKYHNDILYKDQELNPFELSFSHNQVLSMCKDLTFRNVTPSSNKRLVNIHALFNSVNGGLVMYEFIKP